MLSAAQQQVWAPGADATQIALIEAGVVKLVERESGRTFTTPAGQVDWDLSALPFTASGGLSGAYAGELPTLYLPEAPNVTLTGTVTVAANGTAVTGSGTAFDTELDGYVADFSALEIANERVLISSVDSATAITLKSTTPHVVGASAVAVKADVIYLKIRQAGSISWTNVDARYIQVYGRELKSGAQVLPVGDRTCRVRVNFGWAEDGAPADVHMLVGEMLQAWDLRQGGEGDVTRTSKSGVTVSWESFGNKARDFMERARDLRLPMRFAA